MNTMNGFTDTEFMTAEEKLMVLKQWKTFLKQLRTVNYLAMTGADYGEFPTALNKSFTDRLYKHLSGHLDFIAHYSRLGFLSARFGCSESTRETLEKMMRAYPMIDYRDLHAAMINEIKGNRGQEILNNQ